MHWLNKQKEITFPAGSCLEFLILGAFLVEATVFLDVTLYISATLSVSRGGVINV
jgi:hypothetical protein